MEETKMTRRPSIRIMMAAYNGEKYIAKQIESIRNQTYTNWSLIIQDDGSLDETGNVVISFQDDRIEYRVSPEKRHGPLVNFHSIANQEKLGGKTFDYYMFCDQDDIWDIDKIERMLRFIESRDNSIPQLCNSDMRIINENGDIKYDSICTLQGLRYRNCTSLFFSFFVYGCSIMMNQKAFYLVPIIDVNSRLGESIQHDSLYPIFAGMMGEIHLIPEVTMSYRRHGDNYSAQQHYGFNLGRILTRALSLKKLARDHAVVYNQALMIIELLRPIKDDIILNQVERAIKKGGVDALAFFKDNNVDCGSRLKNISRKIILFSKLYIPYLNLLN